jgi:hypothetical protein
MNKQENETIVLSKNIREHKHSHLTFKNRASYI